MHIVADHLLQTNLQTTFALRKCLIQLTVIL